MLLQRYRYESKRLLFARRRAVKLKLSESITSTWKLLKVNKIVASSKVSNRWRDNSDSMLERRVFWKRQATAGRNKRQVETPRRFEGTRCGIRDKLRYRRANGHFRRGSSRERYYSLENIAQVASYGSWIKKRRKVEGKKKKEQLFPKFIPSLV